MLNEALYNGSRDLYYSFGIITTLQVTPSDGIPSSFCQQIYFICSCSVATADEM